MSTVVRRIVPSTEPIHLLHRAPVASPTVAAEMPGDVHSFARLLTVGEVATILRVHPNRVYELASRRALPAVRVGRLLRFHLGTLEQWIDSGGTSTAEVPYAAGRPADRG